MNESRFNVWIMASRPKTLWAAVAPVIIGTAMAFADGKGHWLAAALAAFGAVMIQIGTNFANDYFDFFKGADEGERLGPLRVTQAGLVKPETMRNAFIFVFFIGLCCRDLPHLSWRLADRGDRCFIYYVWYLIYNRSLTTGL